MLNDSLAVEVPAQFESTSFDFQKRLNTVPQLSATVRKSRLGRHSNF